MTSETKTERTLSAIAWPLAAAFLFAACGDDTLSAAPDQPTEIVEMDSLGNRLGPITAAIVRQNARMDIEGNLLARVEVQLNEIVEFYEPAPGYLVVTGGGRPAGGPMVTDIPPGENGMEDLWKTISRGAAMPERLRQGIDRQRYAPYRRPAGLARTIDAVPVTGEADPFAGAHAQNASTTTSSDGNITTTQAALHGGTEWCNTVYGTIVVPEYLGSSALGECDATGFDHVVCLDHRTGTVSASNSETFSIRSNVCPYRGSVTFKLAADSPIPDLTFTVNQDSCRWLRKSDTNCSWDPFDDCPNAKTSVTDSTGDGFHYRFLVITEDT